MRVGYLGPEGTNSHEALLAALGGEQHEQVPLPTIYDCVVAVQELEVDRAFVPIENAIEGSVNAVLDALAVDAEQVRIVGEAIHPIHTCLIAPAPIELSAIETVLSHPQANGQCAHFLRTRLPQARVLAASSTAEAVRAVAEGDAGPNAAALGSRLAAEQYGCEILRAGVDDVAGNETRFVWLAPEGTSAGEHGPWKTAIVFWGVGAEAPGWLVRCLSEFAFRGVNLTRIESRPRKQGLGRYMFFLDLEGSEEEGPVAEALTALRGHTEHLRVLGSFPAA
ncbi:prephenate dehydratase [Conexibacter woesei]|uniref:Prephenate dehydratase n=1 Tax=Conexibacter woesei (strain DSM 14684 / CCUG 47730 / CIP 108061 / JCM 11494 / NBRC 100937 / ID131577) TaxID=469383 RepID=D3EYR1_CONWI|nr:prephenate dehydratase [Conexibacter woesei]ADB48444.1 Prephenate dehydratase [Conexibacter woesei DSM 14684]